MRYSERLQKIENEIRRGETMADVGTDHGFLPIKLYSTGISPFVLLTDISPGSIRKAEQDWDRYLSAEDRKHVSFRVGSGLSPISSGEVDTVVIAGMGGLLISEILSEDLEKTRSFRRYVFQPRNNAGLLRDWLFRHGFRIEREQIAEEGRFLCEILTASSPAESTVQDFFSSGLKQSGEMYGIDLSYTAKMDYPDSLLTCGEPHLKEYLSRRLIGQERIAGDITDCEKDPEGKGYDAVKEDAVRLKNRKAKALSEARAARIRELLSFLEQKEQDKIIRSKADSPVDRF
ncbi:MAG: class I SAM-dependent methyltransferase [Eubacteriales bacterium]|nr:class I SAM-dependent methyltransferase [Eubacteriales bacterium]